VRSNFLPPFLYSLAIIRYPRVPYYSINYSALSLLLTQKYELKIVCVNACG